MKSLRVTSLAALMAALLFLAPAGAIAEPADPCDADPAACLIPPQGSIQLNPSSHTGSAELGAFTDPGLFGSARFAVQVPEFVPAPDLPSVGAPSIDPLPIKLRFQDPSDVSCGIQALGMAMDGVSGPAPSSSSILGFLQDEGMMYSFGTGVEELAHAAHHYGYAQSAAFHGWTIEQLRSELDAGRPVVAALGPNGPDLPGHFVTVTGFSDDGGWVAYNDPILGSRVLPAREFSLLWDLQGNSGVSVRKSSLADAAPDLTPVAAGAAALMAVVALAPLGTKRQGIGGRLIADAGIDGLTPPHAAPAGYRWISKQVPVYETRTVQDGWHIELKPRMLSQWKQVGWTKTKVPVYRNVTVHDGWETYYERERYWKTERYVRYYRTRRIPRYRYYGRYRVYVGSTIRREPVYGYRRVRKTRTVRKRRPRWKTVKEFSHYYTEREPKYGWMLEQDGWDEIREPKFVQRRVQIGTETKWELERLPEPPAPMPPPGPPLPELMLVTNPLKVRSSPGMQGAVLTYASPLDQVKPTGKVETIGDTVWIQVKYVNAFGRNVTGWISKKYVVEPPPNSVSTDSSDDPQISQVDIKKRAWLKLLSEADRADILQREREKYEALQAELARLTANPPYQEQLKWLAEDDQMAIMDDWNAWRDTVLSLANQPQWLTNGGIPPSFLGESEWTVAQREAIQALLSHPTYLSAELSVNTWELAAAVTGKTVPDVLMHALGTLPAGWASTFSAGDFPLDLWVRDKDGVYLRSEPFAGSDPVPAPFRGIPYGSKVVWTGTYHVDKDEGVYYQISFEWEGRTYTGWVPSEFFAPRIANIDKPLFNRTSGYGQGAEGFGDYHAHGAAQYLNLYKLFEDIGYEYQEGEEPFPTAHYNLCGQLAVLASMGVSLEEGFAKIASSDPEMLSALKDPGAETSGDDLESIFEVFDWKASMKSISPANLRDSLQQNQTSLALVSIRNGSVAIDGDTPHWIHVKSIGDDSVTIYNPFSNSEEVVSREVFNVAWASTPGNTTGNLLIEANP